MADDDRKMLRAKALEQMRWTVSNVSADKYVHQTAPLDKLEFVNLLQKNFDRIDRDRSKGISRDEILNAFITLHDLKPEESIMLHLLLRYFDFISDLVEDTAGVTKVISKQDVEVLAQFLLNSPMTLEELYLWCKGAAQDITPPPLTTG